MLKRPEGTSLETESSKRGHDIQKRGDFLQMIFYFSVKHEHFLKVQYLKKSPQDKS